jgi:tRNA(fMet)-specific endonuclease VapC
MRFLFDTDHISILQLRTEPDYSNINARMTRYVPGDLAYSIVSFDEQARGARARINSARHLAEVVHRYRLLEIVLADYVNKVVLPFDAAAASIFSGLPRIRGKIGTMDLRIASIALSRGLILLTRNTRDFGRVPNLIIEDWTI